MFRDNNVHLYKNNPVPVGNIFVYKAGETASKKAKETQKQKQLRQYAASLNKKIGTHLQKNTKILSLLDKNFHHLATLIDDVATQKIKVRPEETESVGKKLKIIASILMRIVSMPIAKTLHKIFEKHSGPGYHPIQKLLMKSLRLTSEETFKSISEIPTMQGLHEAQRILLFIGPKNAREKLLFQVLMRNRVNPIYKNDFAQAADGSFAFKGKSEKPPKSVSEYFPGNDTIYHFDKKQKQLFAYHRKKDGLFHADTDNSVVLKKLAPGDRVYLINTEPSTDKMLSDIPMLRRRKMIKKIYPSGLKLMKNCNEHFVDFFMAQSQIRVQTNWGETYTLVYDKTKGKNGEFVIAEADRERFRETREYKRLARKGVRDIYRLRFYKGNVVYPTSSIPVPPKVPKQLISLPKAGRTIVLGRAPSMRLPGGGKTKEIVRRGRAPKRRLVRMRPRPKPEPSAEETTTKTIAYLKKRMQRKNVESWLTKSQKIDASLQAIRNKDEWNTKANFIIGMNPVLAILNESFKQGNKEFSHEKVFDIVFRQKNISLKHLAEKTAFKVKDPAILKFLTEEFPIPAPPNVPPPNYEEATIPQAVTALNMMGAATVREYQNTQKALNAELQKTGGGENATTKRLDAKITQLQLKIQRIKDMWESIQKKAVALEKLQRALARVKYVPRSRISHVDILHRTTPQLNNKEFAEYNPSVIKNIGNSLPPNMQLFPSFRGMKEIHASGTVLHKIYSKSKTVPFNAVISALLASYSAEKLNKMGCLRKNPGSKFLIIKLPPTFEKNITAIEDALVTKNKKKRFDAERFYKLQLKIIGDPRLRAVMQLERIFSLKHLGPKYQPSAWNYILKFFTGGRYAVNARSYDRRDIIERRITEFNKNTKYLTHSGRHAHLKIYDLILERSGGKPEVFFKKMQQELNDLMQKGLMLAQVKPDVLDIIDVDELLKITGIDLSKKITKQTIVLLKRFGLPEEVITNYNLEGRTIDSSIQKILKKYIKMALIKKRQKDLKSVRINLSKPLTAEQVRLIQLGFVWKERIEETAQRMKAVTTHRTTRKLMAGLYERARVNNSKIPQQAVRGAGVVLGQIISSKAGMQRLIYGDRAKIAFGKSTGISANGDFAFKGNEMTKGIIGVTINQGIVTMRTKYGYFNVGFAAGASGSLTGEGLSGFLGLNASTGGTIFKRKLDQLDWNISFTPLSTAGIPNLSASVTYRSRIETSDFESVITPSIGVTGVSLTLGGQFNAEHAINRRTKATLKRFKLDGILSSKTKKERLTLISLHPQLGPLYKNAIKMIANKTPQARAIIAETLLGFYVEQVRNGVVKDLKVPLILGGGVTLVMGIPIPFISFRIKNKTLVMRSISTKVDQRVSDAQFLAQARKALREHDLVVHKAPISIGAKDGLTFDRETGRRKLKNYHQFDTGEIKFDTTRMYNKQLKGARIRLEKVANRKGLLELKIQSKADRMRIYIDPAMKGKVTVVYSGTRVFLAFKPGTSLYMSRADYHYPYQNRGSNHDTVLYIKKSPATPHAKLRNAKGGTRLERFMYAGKSYTGQWHEVGSRGAVSTAAKTSNNIMPVTEFTRKRGKELDTYKPFRIDLRKHVSAHKKLMEAVASRAKKRPKNIPDAVYSFADRIFKLKRVQFKLDTTLGSGVYSATGLLRTASFVRLIQSHATKDLGRKLTQPEVETVLMHMMHRSFVNLTTGLTKNSSRKEKLRVRRRFERMIRYFAQKHLTRIFTTELQKPKFKVALARMGKSPRHAAMILTNQLIRRMTKGLDLTNPGKAIQAGFMVASLVGTDKIYGMRYLARFGREGYDKNKQDKTKLMLLNMFSMDVNSRNTRDELLARMVLQMLSPVPTAREAIIQPANFLQTPLALKMAPYASFTNLGPEGATLLAQMFKMGDKLTPSFLRKNKKHHQAFSTYFRFIEKARAAQLSGSRMVISNPKKRWMLVIKPTIDVRGGLYKRCGNPTFIAKEKISGTLYVNFNIQAFGNRQRQAEYVRAQLGKDIYGLSLSGALRIQYTPKPIPDKPTPPTPDKPVPPPPDKPVPKPPKSNPNEGGHTDQTPRNGLTQIGPIRDRSTIYIDPSIAPQSIVIPRNGNGGGGGNNNQRGDVPDDL